MSYISQRTVKGKKYYYLEESFFYEGKLVKESVYFGPMYPSNDELFLGDSVLRRTCLARNHTVLNPPLTEFITNRTARIIEKEKNIYKNTFQKLSRNQITKLKKKKVESLKNLVLMNNENIKEKNIEKCINYYSKSLEKKEPLSEAKIKKMHLILYNKNKKQIQKTNSNFMHLLFTWFKEKNDLIHPVEFAAKFCAKFYSLKPFLEGNLILSVIVANYILQEKDFAFINISNRRFLAFQKALNAGEKENYKPITEFFVKEVIKQSKLKF